MSVSLKNFLIEYTVYGKDGSIIHEGTTRAKKKESSFMAKARFGEHIEKKYGDRLGRLHIKSCREEGLFDNMFNQYKNGSNDSQIDALNKLFGGMGGGI